VSAVVVRNHAGVWLEKAALGGLFAGLLTPPMQKTASRKACAKAARDLLAARGIAVPRALMRPTVVERTLTHRRLSIVTYGVRTQKRTGPFVSKAELVETGLSSAAIAVLAAGWPEAQAELVGLGRARNGARSG